ncbi:Acetylcholine receptor subunit alpha-like 1 [Portunus trituberculatus]|uniref:Acetylcholine receptor subunit alpha-like 1 n=1 Tax=Portunus trituberculatus TaxID=210409 RepID=A0A5B7H578_PORTR|nr:Acetylcholine receptor subunit alpha-like 1 [Portunus trituberculatus]
MGAAPLYWRGAALGGTLGPLPLGAPPAAAEWTQYTVCDRTGGGRWPRGAGGGSGGHGGGGGGRGGCGRAWAWVVVAVAWAAVLAPTCHANPDAKRLYDDLLSSYNRLIRPVGNNSDRLTVKLGLKLSQLIDVRLTIPRPSLTLASVISPSLASRPAAGLGTRQGRGTFRATLGGGGGRSRWVVASQLSTRLLPQASPLGPPPPLRISPHADRLHHFDLRRQALQPLPAAVSPRLCVLFNFSLTSVKGIRADFKTFYRKLPAQTQQEAQQEALGSVINADPHNITLRICAD